MGKEFTGKSVQDAIKKGLNEMGIGIDEADIEIVSEGGGGIFGIGAKKAVVRINPLEDEDIIPQKDTAADKIKDKADDIAESIEKVADSIEDKAEELFDRIEDKIEEQLSKEEADKEDLNSDEHIKFLQSFLDGLFERMSIECTYAITQNKDTLTVNISSKESGKLIGHRGETLDAIQYITRLAIHKQSLPYRSIVVQTENYREKREQTLISLANRLAAKVERTGRKVTLEPMKPYERRIIHEALQGSDKVTTDSCGDEPNRYVVILPKRNNEKHL